MNIKVNGEIIETDAATLLELCRQRGHDATVKIATAVNGDFVPESGRTDKLLTDGDEVEIVAPRQGG